MIRSTHTYAILDISPAAYAEIRGKLLAARYDHAFHADEGRDVIDMQGIAIAACRDFPEDAAHENGNYQNRCAVCKGSFIGHKRRVICAACAFDNAGRQEGS